MFFGPEAPVWRKKFHSRGQHGGNFAGCGARDRSDMGGSLEMEAKLKTNLDTNLIKLAAIISLDPFL